CHPRARGRVGDPRAPPSRPPPAPPHRKRLGPIRSPPPWGQGSGEGGGASHVCRPRTLTPALSHRRGRNTTGPLSPPRQRSRRGAESAPARGAVEGGPDRRQVEVRAEQVGRRRVAVRQAGAV